MLLNGDCLYILDWVEPASVDALITDPPAGIGFMGKEWDHDKGGRDQWVNWMTLVMQKAFAAMKPGAHGLIWALPRTSHWTATALENAGFEVRDVVTHLFGSGFPKSLNISKAIDKAAGAERDIIGSLRCKQMDGGEYRKDGNPQIHAPITAPNTEAAKQWDGWGTALKPASEHWILVRKPLSEKTVAANVLKWGVGGINIDGCRISTGGKVVWKVPPTEKQTSSVMVYDKPGDGSDSMFKNKGDRQGTPLGRFPANLVLSHSEHCEDDQCDMFCPVKMLDEQSGVGVSKNSKRGDGIGAGYHQSDKPYNTERGFNDFGGASRFFYCAKISTSERNAGLEGKEGKAFNAKSPIPFHKNHHPTVKSKKLMSYLCKLITPPNGTILDPFMGSGSTGIAAKECGFDFIGIEKEPDYFEIAQKRIGAVNGKNNY